MTANKKRRHKVHPRFRRAIVSRAVARGSVEAFKLVLRHFGVGGLAASIASHFIFKYIFKPIARHLIKGGHVAAVTYHNGAEKVTMHGAKI